MNEVIGFGKTIIGGADGPTSVFIAFKWNPVAFAAALAAGLLICFFGLKLVKVLITLNGLVAGFGVGILVSNAVGTDKIISAIIVFACAVILAALSFFLYRLGIFFMVFVGSVGVLATVTGSVGIGTAFTFSTIGIIVELAVCAVIGILAAIFVGPVIIVMTAISGGLTAGLSITGLVKIGGPGWIGYIIGAVLAAFGIAVQFAMYLKKTGVKKRAHTDEVKEKSSMESELEKARTVLDDED